MHFVMCSLAAAEEGAAATGFYARMGAFTDKLFLPLFGPINTMLAHFDSWAQWIAVCYFIGAWVWVAFILQKEYVNLSCPYKTGLADLRIWTLVAMTPTMFVYIYFN
ncbi:MAG TPA: hypothetical protein ENN29_12735 [Candidatus Hydrogenedentes bacterium]|nr:hypothetical protein [Candidatus Hydrogenedentota bacterium]